MKPNRKRIFAALGIVSALSLLDFLLENGVSAAGDAFPVFLVYLEVFFHRAIGGVIFALTASAAAVLAAKSGKRAVPLAFLLPIGRFLYFLPKRYLVEMAAGSDTGDSLLLALLFSVVRILLLDLLLPIALGLSALFLYQWIRKKPFSPDDPAGGLFDYERPLPFLAFLLAVPPFLYEVLTEAVTAVSYLFEYAGTYEVGEILYMTASFLFLLVLFLLRSFTSIKTVSYLKEAENHETDTPADVGASPARTRK